VSTQVQPTACGGLTAAAGAAIQCQQRCQTHSGVQPLLLLVALLLLGLVLLFTCRAPGNRQFQCWPANRCSVA
jgi:hypothetical protein